MDKIVLFSVIVKLPIHTRTRPQIYGTEPYVALQDIWNKNQI